MQSVELTVRARETTTTNEQVSRTIAEMTATIIAIAVHRR